MRLELQKIALPGHEQRRAPAFIGGDCIRRRRGAR